MKKLALIVTALSTVSVAGIAQAATTASQKFTVNVPANISIEAPTNVAITHDETDNDQNFPAQQWVVKGNTTAGVAVTFSTASAFVHTTDNTWKRDAQMGLALNSSTGPASWTIGVGTDATDYENSDEIATVSASSDGVGRGTFDISMSFVTGSFGTFAAGAYETTVTGTVSSN